MIEIALAYAMGCFAIGLVMTTARLLMAPTIGDRILALDTMVVNVIALVVLYGIYTGDGLNFEVAMLFAMTGFVSSVAFAKYLLRGSVIE